MSWLIDTSASSELSRPKPDRTVLRWFDTHNELEMYFSALTLGELQKGVIRLALGQRRERLVDWFEDLAVRFEARILPVDLEVSRVWGEMVAQAEHRGQPLPVIDSLIAATAIVHDLTVVTRNTRDFLRTGVKTEDPWRA